MALPTDVKAIADEVVKSQRHDLGRPRTRDRGQPKTERGPFILERRRAEQRHDLFWLGAGGAPVVPQPWPRLAYRVRAQHPPADAPAARRPQRRHSRTDRSLADPGLTHLGNPAIDAERVEIDQANGADPR